MPHWLMWIVAFFVVGFAFYLNYAYGYEQGLRDGLKKQAETDETPSK